MKEFKDAAEMHFDRAKELRDSLEELGLIKIDEVYITGARSETRIFLTPLGREVGLLLAAVEDRLQVEEKKTSRNEDPTAESEARMRAAAERARKAMKAGESRVRFD